MVTKVTKAQLQKARNYLLDALGFLQTATAELDPRPDVADESVQWAAEELVSALSLLIHK